MNYQIGSHLRWVSFSVAVFALLLVSFAMSSTVSATSGTLNSTTDTVLTEDGLSAWRFISGTHLGGTVPVRFSEPL